MAGNLISSLLSKGAAILPSIRASVQAPSSSNNNSEKERRAFEETLERLMQTLEMIKATLYDAEEREIRDRSVKLWLKELKTVAYAAEDVFSEYRYEATRMQVEARKASQAMKKKEMESTIPIPDGMADQLNKIRNRFDEIAKDREVLQLRESDGMRRANTKILQPLSGHMVDEANIFGRDAEIREVIDLLLLEKEKPFSVISIVGKGGLGKTTIAQLVFKDANVRQCFDIFGWVCVSEDFNVERIIKATIESITRNSSNLSELSPLQEELAKIVTETKILLVLDDVWNENQSLWESFQVAFKEANLVRILVTTRNEKVAKIMLTRACFKPNYLPENYCWQLFQHYAFGGTRDTLPIHFIKMGREITRKCGGLPLAVKSIASLLRYETDEESWKDILESDLWESNPSNDIFPALQISYAHLPAHLKPCFLLLSMYPKDYEIPKSNLIKLWISHGYIKSIGKRTIREGVEYYEELKERSFIDVQTKNKCKLHDIIHDLAMLNSEKEHYMVDINRIDDIQKVNIPQEVHHLYVRSSIRSVNEIFQQNMRGLRTLSMDLHGFKEYSKHCINKLEVKDLSLRNTIFNLKNFGPLRVLELQGDCLRGIPDSIAQLKHLSYLRIASGSLEYLPESIGFLYNLQTFILNCFYSPLRYLPESIGYLTNIHDMHIECVNFKKLPKSLCLLGNLQRLVFQSRILEEVPLNPRQLCNLEQLIIHCSQKELSGEVDFRSKGALRELLVALESCSKLKILKITGCCIEYNPHSLNNFLEVSIMVACLRVRNIGWLKDMNYLEGELTIEGLENTSNLLDAQLANLSRKCKVNTLNIHWHIDHHLHDQGDRILRITLLKEIDESSKAVDQDMNFGLLECLQPHPHLKRLQLQSYPCATIPSWLGDPFSLQAIQDIILQGCDGLKSLPFCNLHTLKYLKVYECSGILLLQLEQLPSQLETLQILRCKKLELIPGLRKLGMLTALRVTDCGALKLITMDELPLVELTDRSGNSSHELPRDGWQSTSSLLKLFIWGCPLLHVLPPELAQFGPSYVSVGGRVCLDLCFGYQSSIY